MNIAASPVHTTFSAALEAHRAGDFARAYTLYTGVLLQEPGNVDALHLGGVARMRAGFPDEGAALMRRALAVHGDAWAIWNNLGNALNAALQFEGALEAYGRASALAPGEAMPYRNRGVVLIRLGDPRAALAALQRSLELNPADAEALAWSGHAQLELKQPAQAMGAYRAALQRTPSLLNARFGEANALHDLGDRDGALAAYRAVAAEFPAARVARSYAFCLAVNQADWSDYDAELAALTHAGAESHVEPFALLGLPVSGEFQRRIATQKAAELCNVRKLELPRRNPTRSRLRVGYLSCDLREHATAYLLAEVLEAHDRSAVEVYAYSWGIDDASEGRRRIRQASAEFRDVDGLSDAAAAQLIRDDDIDVLVDLKGYTQHHRLGILARHPARVQVSWLGYPGTLGAPFVEYLIADGFTVPTELEPLYSEAVVRLPGTYQPNDRRREVSPPRARRDWGLPDDAVVFCAFAQGFKLTPVLFDAWMNILRRVPGSVLWLLGNDAAFVRNIGREARKRAIDPVRLVFAPRVPVEDHLARYHAADLALDTFPCGSHTTASDALWVGCPLIALAGETFASRVSGSVVRAAGLPEQMITRTLPEYEDLAVELAMKPAKRAALREYLLTGGRASTLFDSTARARDLERAYRAVCERWTAGLAPDAIWLS